MNIPDQVLLAVRVVNGAITVEYAEDETVARFAVDKARCVIDREFNAKEIREAMEKAHQRRVVVPINGGLR